MEKPRVYLSARISADAHAANNQVCDAIADSFEVFKPHEHNPWNIDHRRLQRDVYETDLNAMKASHMGLLLAPYGRDCAWEVGWYIGAHKPIVAFSFGDDDWLRDWMIKGGLSAAVTTHEGLYNKLKFEDPMLGAKAFFIKDLRELASIMSQVYRQSVSAGSPLFNELHGLNGHNVVKPGSVEQL